MGLVKRMMYRRVANLGDFESVHIEVEAEIEKDEKPGVVYADLKAMVDKAIAFEVKENLKVQRNDKGARIDS